MGTGDGRSSSRRRADAAASAPAPAPASGDAPAVEEGTDRASRIAQVAMGALLGIVSALLMVTCHRLSLDVAGLELPIGLILGAVLQTACCVFLLASTGRRLGVVVLAVVWFLVALPFAGQSAGGGVLMPAAIGEEVQYQGWAVQILGIGIPLLALAACWVQRIRRLSSLSGAARP